MQSRSNYGAVGRILHALLAAILAAIWLAAPAAAAAPAVRVLALGDSLTAGYQLKPAESFPAQLQAALRARGVNATVINAGVSGDTTTQARARLGWVLNSQQRAPDLAIVALGANDMLRGQSPAVAERNLDAILQEFGRRRIPVILAGMRAAPNLGAAYARAFEPIYARLARRHGAALYPFFTAGVTGHPQLLLADGMHPNARGVGVMVRGMLPLVERQLGRAP